MNRISSLAALISVAALLGLGSAADASVVIPLTLDDADSGWTVTVPNDVHFDVVVDAIQEGAEGFVVIEISKEFTEGLTGGGLGPPTLPSVEFGFDQVGSDANTVPRIVIADEIITNSTGTDWVAFSWFLLDGGNVSFNSALSSSFSVSPEFTTITFLDSDTQLDATGGAGILSGGPSWSPGGLDGDLVIDIDVATEPGLTFVLKELPVPVPEPSIVTMLGLGGLALLRRRRRR